MVWENKPRKEEAVISLRTLLSLSLNATDC